jgi:hypothetical protein
MRRVDTIYLVARESFSQPEVRRKVKIGSVFFIIFLTVAGIALTSIPRWSSISSAESLTAPDFRVDKVRKINADDEKVTFQVEKNGKVEVWYYAVNTDELTGISKDSDISDDFPIGIKDKYILWLSKDKRKLFVFDSESGKRLEEAVALPSPAKGEKVRVRIWGVPWEVVITSDNFFFYSKKTGEIFSDDDGDVKEKFRHKFDLDSSMADEELVNLGFQVGEEGDE